jgi:ATP-binding cassette subfamily B protein RaxB
MVAAYHGHVIDMVSLRQKYPISLKGAVLSDLIKIAAKMGMQSRPLRLEIDDLQYLQLPCILHWDMNHFVVLVEVRNDYLIIHDPSCGRRQVSMDAASRHFTGVALELWPSPDFKRGNHGSLVSLSSVVQPNRTLGTAVLGVFALAVVLEVLALINPLYLRWVTDRVIVSGDMGLLTKLAAGFAFIVLIQQLISYLRLWIIVKVSAQVGVAWRINIFSHLVGLPVQYFEKRFLGDIASRFGAIEQIQRTLTSSFIEGLLDGLMVTVTGVVIFYYSVSLGSIVLGSMLLYALCRFIWYRKLRLASEEQIAHTAKQQTHFIETIRGIRALKLFQRLPERQNAWAALLAEQVNAESRTQLQHIGFRAVNGLLFGLENVIVIWLSGRLILSGNFTVGMLLAFIAYKTEFTRRMSSLVDKLFDLRLLRLQLERIADIVLTPQEGANSKSSELGVDAELDDASVAISGLSFRYSEGEHNTLRNLNLRIPAGQSVAIVGPSGSGKTTLVKLLLGTLTPTEGSIRISGQDSCSESVRDAVATVMQDDTLFAGSVAENICFFSPNPDMAWIKECARMAAVALEIEVMPMGYNTLIAEMGTALSGGQKQRILIARALYKRPKLLILDEATSHLDIMREQEVNAAIRELKITRIIVAHRRETIASADRVVALVDGEIMRDIIPGEVEHAATGIDESNLDTVNG